MGFTISGVVSIPDYYQSFYGDYNTSLIATASFTQGGGSYFYIYPNGTQGAGTYTMNASLNEIRLSSKPTWAIDFTSPSYR